MAVTVRSYGVSPGADSASCVVVKPTGLAVGDLMVAHIFGTGNSSLTITPPSIYWTSIRSEQLTSPQYCKSELFWKIADADDVAASNFTFTITNGVSNVGAIFAIYGHHDSSPIDQNNGQTNAASTTITSLGVTPSVADCLLIIFASISDNNNANADWTIVNNNPTWSDQYELSKNLSDDILIAAGTAIYGYTSATGNGTLTMNASDTNIGQMIAIKPSQNVVVTPGVLNLTTTKYVPVIKENIPIPVEELTTTSFIPIFGLGIITTTLGLTLTKYAIVLKLGLSPPVKELVLTTYAPTIDVSGNPGNALLKEDGYNLLTENGDYILLDGEESVVVTPTTATLTITKYAPILKETLTPSTKALSLTIYAPSAIIGTICTPSTLSLTTTKYAPILKEALTPTTKSLDLTEYAPTVTAPCLVTPTTFALTLTVYAPTVNIAITVVPSTASLTLTPYAPTIITPVTATPITATLTITTYAPTVLAGNNILITPITVALTLTGYAPIPYANLSYYPAEPFLARVPRRELTMGIPVEDVILRVPNRSLELVRR